MTDRRKGINTLRRRCYDVSMRVSSLPRDVCTLWCAVFAVVAAGCDGCGVRSEADASIDGNDIVVNADGVVIRRGGVDVVVVHPDDIGVKKGSAFYDMQFGMFDIQEDDDAFVFGDSAVLTGFSDDTLTFDVKKGEDVIASVIVIEAEEDGVGVRLQVTAAGDNDRIVLRTPCGANDHFIGLGSQTADVDHRGQIVPLCVSEQGVCKTSDLPKTKSPLTGQAA